MADRKRAHPDEDGSVGKLAKKSSGSDVASSKAKKKTSSGAVPPKGQDQEGNTYWEVRDECTLVFISPASNVYSSPRCAGLALPTFGARR